MTHRVDVLLLRGTRILATFAVEERLLNKGSYSIRRKGLHYLCYEEQSYACLCTEYRADLRRGWLSYIPGHSRLAGFHEEADDCNQKTHPPKN